HPFVKIFEEERELTVMLLIDVSGSRDFGTVRQTKKDMITEIAAVLAFSTIQNNDKIGVIFFSDRIEKFIPPQKGRKHVLHIIRELIDFQPKSNKTNIAEALKYFTNAIKKSSAAFVISDFMDENFEQELTISSKKHDIAAIQIFDIRETELPKVGILKLKNAETGQRIYIDTSDNKVRKMYKHSWEETQLANQKAFTRSGVDTVAISTADDYVKKLMMLFKFRQ
ncbi:MAG: VWA domain-containing protein, partial [Paludibacter sp.]|nr:VWA domain-containing protein [Paludibacter sp.]